MYLKPDSALLVNDKPFYIPPFAKEVEIHPCAVVRISRLGKNIAPKFAYRYFDGLTMGMNMVATDVLETALETHQPWMQAVSFDNSLIVGRMHDAAEGSFDNWELRMDEKPVGSWTMDDLVMPIEDAISRLSSVVSIRMGDMIAVDFRTKALPAQVGTKAEGWINEEICFSNKIR